MRKSRVLLAGVAVAAAAAATSAFTAANTFEPGVDQAVAGYGEASVSGANITAIHYNKDSSDQSLVESVVWETDTDLTGLNAATGATMTLKKAGLYVDDYTCAITGTALAGIVTCNVGDKTFFDFDAVGLAVGGE
jgi:hypothetical protein